MANAQHSPGLTINNEFKFYLKNAINSQLALKPGQHHFGFQADNIYSELTSLSLKLKAGSIYYIRVNTSLKLKTTEGYQPYQRRFNLTLVDETLAIKEIADCCLKHDTKSKENIVKKADDKPASKGFSVDKTQNPFSH